MILCGDGLSAYINGVDNNIAIEVTYFSVVSISIGQFDFCRKHCIYYIN